MVESGTVRKLLETIETRLTRLVALSSVSFEEYRSQPELQDRVERNLEVAIQAAIDLGLHVLADRSEPVPDTNRAVFLALASSGILTDDLARKLERMAGFRNILVHGYADLDHRRVHECLTRLDDIREFVRQMMGSLVLPTPTR